MTKFSQSIKNKALIVLHDAAIICCAWIAAYWFRFNLTSVPAEYLSSAEKFLPLLILSQVTAMAFFGVYRSLWWFTSMPDLIKILKSTASSIPVSVVALFLFGQLQSIPRSIMPLYAVLLLVGLCGPRLLYRWYRDQQTQTQSGKRVLIVGAGQAGEGLIRDLLRSKTEKYSPVAIVDDLNQKQGLEIHGVRVIGKTKDIPEIVSHHDIDLIFIAIPSASSVSMRRVVNYCEKSKVPFSTLPSLADLSSGKVSIQALREVSLEDLLGRDQAELDWMSIQAELNSKTILITGAGGSIGSELCRQIANLNPSKLILLDHSEYGLYAIELELKKQFPNLSLEVHLASILDELAISSVFSKTKPNYVFHAAAYKHVPMLEFQIRTAVINNIIGTHRVCKAAVENHVEKFMLISTDKAVNPTNIMGATKRAAELVCQGYNSFQRTKFITIRFGNVLGSAGSVIPLFKQQLRSGGPITVTDPDITRFFMTIPEACQLIMQSTTIGEGGEIFVLDMGEPVKIRYLAEQLIRLSGKTLGSDIEIQYTGLRPGEKLYEELFYQTEHMLNTSHEKILQAKHKTVDCDAILAAIARFELSCQQDPKALCDLLQKFVPEFALQTASSDEQRKALITEPT